MRQKPHFFVRKLQKHLYNMYKISKENFPCKRQKKTLQILTPVVII